MNLPDFYRAPARLVVAVLCCAALLGVYRLLKPHQNQPVEAARSSLILLDGRLCLRGQTNLFTGIMVENSESGVLLSRSAVSNGLLEGASEGFYTNGQRQVLEYFHAGVSDGLRTKWHPNGRKLSEATIVAGKLQGTFRRWSEDGALVEEIDMNQGNPHGVARSFYPSGFLKAEAHMRSGKLLDQKSWKDGEYRPTSSGA